MGESRRLDGASVSVPPKAKDTNEEQISSVPCTSRLLAEFYEAKERVRC